jgi:hypothetical protein
MEFLSFAGLYYNQISGHLAGLVGSPSPCLPVSASCFLASTFDPWNILWFFGVPAVTAVAVSIIGAKITLALHSQSLRSLHGQLERLDSSLKELARDRQKCREECLTSFVDRREHTQMVGSFTASEQELTRTMRDQTKTFDASISAIHERVNDVLKSVSKIEGWLSGKDQRHERIGH